jgi:hypothetical protein
MFLMLPESPLWLLSSGRFGAATLVSHRLLRERVLRQGTLLARTVVFDTAGVHSLTPLRPGRLAALSILSFAHPWATVAFPLLSGASASEGRPILRRALLYRPFDIRSAHRPIFAGAQHLDGGDVPEKISFYSDLRCIVDQSNRGGDQPAIPFPLLHDVGLSGVFLVIINAAPVSLVVILVFGPRGENRTPGHLTSFEGSIYLVPVRARSQARSERIVS